MNVKAQVLTSCPDQRPFLAKLKSYKSYIRRKSKRQTSKHSHSDQSSIFCSKEAESMNEHEDKLERLRRRIKNKQIELETLRKSIQKEGKRII